MRGDDIPFPIHQSQLSASQQYALQYVLDILSKMETVSDEYNDYDTDEDNYEPCLSGTFTYLHNKHLRKMQFSKILSRSMYIQVHFPLILS